MLTYYDYLGYELLINGKKKIVGVGDSIKVVGGNGDDILVGSAKNEILYGNNGNDIIMPGTGLDFVNGGNGKDRLVIAGVPLDYDAFQFNGYKQRIADSDGNVVDFVQIETIDFYFVPTTSYATGVYSIDVTGAVDNVAYVQDLGLQTTNEDTVFKLDLKTLSWDYEDLSTWGGGANNMSGQKLHFNFTNLTFHVVDPAKVHGNVEVTADGILTYTPNLNEDGLDSISFAVSDGVNVDVIRNYAIQVRAVADAPELSVNVSQDVKINNIIFDVNTMLKDLDGSENLSLVFSDLPDNVDLFLLYNNNMQLVAKGINDQDDPNDDNGMIDLGNLPDLHNLRFVLSLDKYADHNFDFTITAISDEGEVGTDGVIPAVRFAETSHTTHIEYDYNYNKTIGRVEDENMSLWHPGSAAGDAFQQTKTANLSFGDTLDLSGEIISVVDYEVSINPSIKSTASISGGSLATNLNYDATFESFYNKTTDTYDIETDQNRDVLNTSWFETIGPNMELSYDLFLFLAFSIDIQIKLKAGDITLFDENVLSEAWSDFYSTHIFTIDADSPDFVLNTPKGSITANLPSVDTTSTFSEANGLLVSDGSDRILFANIDMDSFLVPHGINNYHAGLPGGGAEVSILSLDILENVFFNQNFKMHLGDIGAIMTLEGGQNFDITLGESLRVNNASGIDLNDDGNINYSALLDFDPILQNETSLIFNASYLLKVLSASVEISVGEDPFDAGFDRSDTAYERAGTLVGDSYLPLVLVQFSPDTSTVALAFDA